MQSLLQDLPTAEAGMVSEEMIALWLLFFPFLYVPAIGREQTRA